MLAVTVAPDMKRHCPPRSAWPKRQALSPSEPSPASPVAVGRTNTRPRNGGGGGSGHVIINPFVDLLRYRKALEQAAAAPSSSPYALRETYCAPLLQTPRTSQAPSTPPRMVRQKYRFKDVFFKPPPPPACSPGYYTPRRTPQVSRPNDK